MDDAAATLATIALLWGAAAVAPGPNFLLTTQTAISSGRAGGLKVALGLACGSAFWGFAGFFGVQAVFKMVPWLYGALKIGGALYLLVTGLRLAVRSFRPAPEARRSHGEGGSELGSGLAISIANPYSALSAASLFAATLPPTPPVWLGLAAVGLMSSIAIVWYGFVACALTVGSAARIFRSLRHWVDRIAGLAFVVFGVRMAVRD